MSYKKKTWLLIAVATMLRCIIAVSIDLGNDEVYYRMYAQQLQWNYFDHPPMTGWLIRLTTLNLFFDSEFFIRLGAVISAAITTWLFFCCGKKLNNAYSGFLAAGIYTATIYGSIISGTFILPDSPQMIFWAGGLYLLINITSYTNINRTKKTDMLLFGIAMGLGMLCKIHTSFLWLGFFLYALFHNRQWFKEPVLYIAGLITLVLFYPVIQWNINNHFVTYLYHSKRVDVSSGGFQLSSFLSFAGGQVFYSNPIIFLLLVTALIQSIKNRLPVLLSQKRILLYSSLPLIVLATGLSFFREVLPHWTGPAYSGLILLAACYLSKQKEQTIFKRRFMPPVLTAAISLLFIIIIGGVLLINYLPGTLGKQDKQIFGEDDFTLDMYGWKSLKTEMRAIIKTDLRSGIMKQDAVIICNKWFPASHIDHYVAIPLKKNLQIGRAHV